jgi:hypothetical protein
MPISSHSWSVALFTDLASALRSVIGTVELALVVLGLQTKPER